MEFETEKTTLLQKIAFPCMAIAMFAPMAVGFGIGYVVLNFFGKWDAVNEIWQRPISSLSLNDISTVLVSGCVMFVTVWIGKEIGARAMDATEDWFSEKELSAMALTDEDIWVYECPRCKKSNTYRLFAGPDQYGGNAYKCSTPDCDREVSEKSLAREIHRKD
ncbi:MAG: hypothetical protein E6J74_33515 [Deltaproteobacteria bacterium]|nr:MAG: hypothetical protein E6J74_33515 [Deltaproteobacteria bacterium]